MNPIELNKKIMDALRLLPSGFESEELINWAYTPDSKIPGYIADLKKFLEIKNPSDLERQKAGYLLEKILATAFKGLTGYSELKSYRSANHQLDFLISGDGTEWDVICDRVYIKQHGYRGIVVEAKAIGKTVSSAQFARLCSIMSLELCNTVGLGIFFTLEGAAGFPKRDGRRVLGIREARLCQILFHAKTNKKIVVLDKEDIFELDQNGALLRILIRKVRELEELSGLQTAPIDQLIDIDLPDYLLEIL